MKILNQLSSQQGDKTEKSNRVVAEQCLKDPKLLDEVVIGFLDKDKKLRSDCIEVCTMISETHPELVLPYVTNMIPLLADKDTKTRWEAVHTFSYIADKVPDVISSILSNIIMDGALSRARLNNFLKYIWVFTPSWKSSFKYLHWMTSTGRSY